jgi:Mce-associated membrane protein
MAVHAGATDTELSAQARRALTDDTREERDTRSSTNDSDATTADRDDIDAVASSSRNTARAALLFGTVMAAALAVAVGWTGYRCSENHQIDLQRSQLLQAARQGALNLTTISYTEIEADVARILDSSTAQFHDEFQQRSAPFVDVVKKAQSQSQGAITEAALETDDGQSAQALVAVSVKTSSAGVADQQPRLWRMRIGVQMVGDTAKVSTVEFVP